MLTIISTIPLVGLGLIITRDSKETKIIGLITTLIILILYPTIWALLNMNNDNNQIIEAWGMGVGEVIGVDWISIYMIGITITLMPICILSTWSRECGKRYIGLWLILETILIIVYLWVDILWFYITFEASLIPMYIIIGRYGGKRRVNAAYQIFLITLLGSMWMLISIIIIYSQVGSTDYQIIKLTELTEERERMIWIGVYIAMAVKTPLVPVHLWLPEAHSEANIAGSIILAGVLLKLAGYGYIRISISLLGVASRYYIPLVYGMSIISIIYCSMTTLRQIDMKKIIAYSSIGHMGIVVIGIFSMTVEGLEGSIILMVGHGLVSPGLFIIVTILYESKGTRIIKYYRGIIGSSPLIGIWLIIFTLANMGIPLSSNFIGEILCVMGGWERNPISTTLASTGIILGGCYSIWLFNRIIFGSPSIYYTGIDISRRQNAQLIPLIILIIIIGMCPNMILETMHQGISNIIWV